MKIGVITISDRASRGEYEDKSGPAIERWLQNAVSSSFEVLREIVPDGVSSVSNILVRLCDEMHADLILTTGGTGPGPDDLTPEAMRTVCDTELPGFGELMRRVSLETVPTAILSRQSAYTRGHTLIVNLPGRPEAIDVCLDSIFAAVPYCLDLIGADRIETDPKVLEAFRPKE